MKGPHFDGVYRGDDVTMPRGEASRHGLLFSQPRELVAHVTRTVDIPGAYSISLPPKVVTNNLTNYGPI